MMQAETHRQGHFHTLMIVLGIAAAYYVTGRLGLLLAIPPGYASLASFRHRLGRDPHRRLSGMARRPVRVWAA